MIDTKKTADLENNVAEGNSIVSLDIINSISIRPSEEIVINSWEQFGKLSKLSWQTAISYTFCLEMVALVYLLSQVSKEEDNLAAITQITGLINTLVCVSISPLLAMSLVAGKDLGRLNEAVANGEAEEQLLSRKERISAVLRNGLIIAVPMTIVAGLPMIFSKDILIKFFNQKPAVAQITQNFVRPYAIAVPGIMIRIVTSQIMFMFGRTKPAMIIGFGSLLVGMTIGCIYAYGWLGAPKLGNDGIMIGAILNEWATAILYAGYIAWSPRLKNYNF
ncbi:MAG TPA: MATE family efflux transporter, partial [Legionellaceae bacterium]|nr:MATE family efflux transporter [Legionellaceae bacterium]